MLVDTPCLPNNAGVCVHNPLRVKYFHGVAAGNTHACSLKSRIGEVSRIREIRVQILVLMGSPFELLLDSFLYGDNFFDPECRGAQIIDPRTRVPCPHVRRTARRAHTKHIEVDRMQRCEQLQ
jgi:hypothetical protein